MKKFNLLLCFVLLFFFGFAVKAQKSYAEKLNLPGDNLNLYAVMKLFQESETLEGFEKNLNAEDSKINNLDLNNDNLIDYIRVIDYPNGEDHTIVLQVAVNEKENQDVAVFTVDKDGNDQVHIQLVGDEELYGKNYIIEPGYADNAANGGTPNPGYSGNTNRQGRNEVATRTTYVEVSSWPLIRFMFMPSYIVWRSPWYWGYYPHYWNPWRPYYWDYYYGYHSHFRHQYFSYYRPSHYNHYQHWNDYYFNSHRQYSNTVYQHRASGTYRNTYSRPDLRKEGSEAYTKRYSNNDVRSSGRLDRNEGINRNRNDNGHNRSIPDRGDVNRSGRPVNRNVENPRLERKQGDSRERATNRASENNRENRSSVNEKSGRQHSNNPSVRSETPRNQPKQENAKRSSENQRSERSSVRRSERNSVKSSERNSGNNSERNSGKSSERHTENNSGRRK